MMLPLLDYCIIYLRNKQSPELFAEKLIKTHSQVLFTDNN